MTYNQLSQKDFEERVSKNNPNLKIISKYKNAHSPIKYKCKICGTEGICNEANAIMRGVSGCGVCGGRKLVIGKNDFATIYPQYLVYFKNKKEAYNYTFGSSQEVDMVCPICHNERKQKLSDLVNKGFACPKCGKGYSYPNRFMYCLLKQLNIPFEREKMFEWSNRRIYDFVIENNKIIIEMDGIFHKTGIIGFNKNINQKEIDRQKNLMATQNGYKIIRINCFKSDFEYIKNNILNSSLFNYFDLNEFDWDKLENELINHNLLSYAVDMFNNNLGILSMKEMAEKLKISSFEFCKLLKKANKLNLVNYNVEDSKRGLYTPSKNIKRKKVYCVEKDKVFESISQAEKILNIPKDCVGRVCRKERQSVYGLHFYFI